jgi:signal peptidase I
MTNAELPAMAGTSLSPRELPLKLLRHAGIRSPLVLELLKFLCVGAICCCSYGICNHFLLGSITVVGKSMHPTLHDSDCYLLNRWILRVREPRFAELIVLRDPVEDILAVKRVVGCPGDSVCFKGGAVYVNGLKLCEPYLPSGTKTYTQRSSNCSFKCGPNQYFVLGDNRSNSADSRMYGPVARARLLGLVIN